eukprot:g3218.t1
MEVCCLLFKVKPILEKDPNNLGGKIKNYFAASKKGLLGQGAKVFLSMLFKFDKDNIPDKLATRLGKYVANPMFDPKVIEKASKACRAICMWARAMYTYHNVAKEVEPKRQKLAQAQSELAVTMGKLRKEQEKLDKVSSIVLTIDPMYEYSLQWFSRLFGIGIDEAPDAVEIEDRVQNLIDYFTYKLYVNICRSLFEKHKLLFSFITAVAVLRGNNLINSNEWRFLISGQGPSNAEESKNPDPSWIVTRAWESICILSTLSSFKGLSESFKDDLEDWKKFFDSNKPHRHELPSRWKDLESLQRMCILNCLRPDKITFALQDYVTEKLGSKFVEPPPFDLKEYWIKAGVAMVCSLSYEAEIATISGGFKWPYREVLVERWGTHFFSSDVLSDERKARDWVLKMGRAKVAYFHFHDENERQDVERTIIRNSGLVRNQIIFIEVLSDPSTWTGLLHDEDKYDDDWNEVLGNLSTNIAASVISSDVDPADESWRVRRKALGNWLNDTKNFKVQFLFSLCDGCHLRIGGRWQENKLDPVEVGDQDEAKHLTLGSVFEKSHPVLSNVHNIDGGERTIFATGKARGKIIATWSNGVPLVVESERSLGINLFPISGAPLWEKCDDNDIEVLIGNSVTWAMVRGLSF